jgi:AcrR family transcriptional regulator
VEAVARIEDFKHGRVPRELRRQQLLELAEELFGERGYEGSSMDELCRRAGVTKPVVYELFGSKDGLFRACLERWGVQLAASIVEAVRAHQEPEDRLRAGGLAFLRFAAGHRVGWDLMSAGGGRFADAAAAIRGSQAQLILGLMEEMAPQGADRLELELIAHAVNSAYEGVAHWMWEHPDVPLEQLADWTVELLLPGLRRFT